MRLAFLLASGALLSTVAAAQTPPAANALVSLAPSDFAPRSAADPEPDTTAPWTYYPLAVGNAWESEDDEGLLKRVSIEKDTVALGRRYFLLQTEFVQDGEVVYSGGVPVRYDSASTTVRFLRAGDPERGIPPADVDFISCPFDAPFGAVVDCESDHSPDLSHMVGGGYDGVLVFGGDRPGTGEDTVRTAVKTYVSWAGVETRYAAGVGVVFEAADGFSRGLTYYRVGGEEHGVARFVASEVGGPEPQAATLTAWPNPTAGPITISVQPSGPSRDVEIAVYDMLGRAVRRLPLGSRDATEHRTTIDLSSLPAGPYVVFLRLEGSYTAAYRISLIR